MSLPNNTAGGGQGTLQRALAAKTNKHKPKAKT